MRLLDLNNKYTDKDTTHSYLDLYDILLKPLQHTATHVLEVGIGNFEEKMVVVYFYGRNILVKQQHME